MQIQSVFLCIVLFTQYCFECLDIDNVYFINLDVYFSIAICQLSHVIMCFLIQYFMEINCDLLVGKVQNVGMIRIKSLVTLKFDGDHVHFELKKE